MDNILVVDDNQDFLEVMKTFLKKEFVVDTAQTAIEALHKLQQNTYKAVLLDISLPDYTGYYLGKLIRKQNNAVPLAVLTNYDGEVTRKNAEEIHAEFWKKSDVVTLPSSLTENIRNLYEH